MTDARPPLAARLIFALTADKNYRTPIIGDLNEEFIQRRNLSRCRADLWYMGQALQSAPYLLWIQFIERPKDSRTIFLLAGALAYGLIMVWDSIVGSYLTNSIAEQFHEGDQSAEKYISAAATLLAVALTGGGVAGVFFDENTPLKKNIMVFLPPMYGVLVMLAGLKRLFVNCENSIIFQLTFIASVAPALVLGASLLFWMKKISTRL